MVGNGVTNWKYDTTNAYLKMGYWHSLYDTKTYEELQENKCDFSGIEFDKMPSQKCLDLFDRFNNFTDKVNIYNIFGYCYGLPSEDGSHENFAKSYEMGFTTVNGHLKTFKKSFSARDYTPWATHSNYKLNAGLRKPHHA